MRFAVVVRCEVIVVSGGTKTSAITGIPACVVTIARGPPQSSRAIRRRAAQQEAFLGLRIYHRPKLRARLCLISPNPPSLLHLFPAPLIISDGGFA